MNGLVCPGCAARVDDPDARFCVRCSMPLTPGGDGPLDRAESDRHDRARKIDPRFTEGDLVRVAGARHQAEAELIQGMLLEEGVPSILRRTAGFDVPDFLAAGPRDVLVPASGAEAAVETLRGTGLEAVRGEPRRTADDLRLAARITAAVVLGGGGAAIAAWAIVEFG